ncbi:hypothetical protein [Streptomyces sp. SLBN-118]|uniref:hypothetical protein n=1 Tax=Streptomyces sp. SLBN-118 TaxID=2768454 RepID=UPI00135CBC9F|nr:hypothetical protein [Streptomyces sp. SLBN-118]
MRALVAVRRQVRFWRDELKHASRMRVAMVETVVLSASIRRLVAHKVRSITHRSGR